MSIQKQKNQLRKKHQKLRCCLSDSDIINKSLKICALIEQNGDFKNAKNILFFASKNFEVNLFSLIEKLLKTNDKNVYLPFVDEKKENLEAKKIKNILDLKKGKFGILCPNDDCKKINPKNIDLFLIPAVCVDQNGNRIGFGGGYFDKFLAKTNAKKIAVIFACQMVDKIAPESHDVSVDAVVNEDGLKYF